MAAMTMIQALNSALDTMMERDPNVLTFGEDVGYFGGVFKVTEHLQEKYGKKRCFDSPINENGIAGVAARCRRPASICSTIPRRTSKT
jgi:2-oxoisovalerate dehydrogenase E1 component beta subunit